MNNIEKLWYVNFSTFELSLLDFKFSFSSFWRNWKWISSKLKAVFSLATIALANKGLFSGNFKILAYKSLSSSADN